MLLQVMLASGCPSYLAELEHGVVRVAGVPHGVGASQKHLRTPTTIAIEVDHIDRHRRRRSTMSEVETKPQLHPMRTWKGMSGTASRMRSRRSQGHSFKKRSATSNVAPPQFSKL